MVLIAEVELSRIRVHGETMFLFTLQFWGYSIQEDSRNLWWIVLTASCLHSCSLKVIKPSFLLPCRWVIYFVSPHRVQTTLVPLDLFVLCLSIVRNGNVSIVTRTGMLLRFSMKLSHGITTKEFQASNSAFFFSKKRNSLAEKVTLPFQKIG